MLFPRSVAVSYYLAVEYQRILTGQILRQVRYRRAEKTFLFLIGGTEDHWLEFSFAPPRFVLRRGKPEPSDAFDVWLEIAGSTISRVSGRIDDRIIDFQLTGESETGTAEDWTIRFELFGALCNALLLDSAGNIEHATRVVSDSRALRPGMSYSEPGTFKPLRQIGEAVIFESEAATYKLRYQRHIHQVIAEVKPGKLAFKPDHRQPLLSLFEGLAAGEVGENVADRAKQRLTQQLARELAHRRDQLQQLRQRLEHCAAAEKFRQWADLLMANPHARPQGSEVIVQDLYNEGQIGIPLRPGKSIIENATLYYRSASKLARAPEYLKRRIAAIEKRIQQLEQAGSRLAEFDDPAEIKKLAAELGSSRRARQRGTGKDPEESRPYRSFSGPGGERILVGKSAADNDTLTFRIARSYDYWFHTQQSRGSHVILVVQDKNQTPSRRTIETAAALAAYYSDERKGDHVPVIYTQRRHVRKARKSAPGLVIPQQVESIFVTPGQPQSDKSDLD